MCYVCSSARTGTSSLVRPPLSTGDVFPVSRGKFPVKMRRLGERTFDSGHVVPKNYVTHMKVFELKIFFYASRYVKTRPLGSIWALLSGSSSDLDVQPAGWRTLR